MLRDILPNKLVMVAVVEGRGSSKSFKFHKRCEIILVADLGLLNIMGGNFSSKL